jgi:hypothetical protein
METEASYYVVVVEKTKGSKINLIMQHKRKTQIYW